MSLSAYLESHPPAPGEVVDVRNAADELSEWAEAALQTVGKVVEENGFTRRRTEVRAAAARIAYTLGQRTVQLEASTDPREGPAYYNVVLVVDGEPGRRAVALWRVVRLAEGTDTAGEYPFPMGAEVVPSLRRAAQDLARHGGPSWPGRRAHSRRPMPRKWHTCAPNARTPTDQKARPSGQKSC